MANDPGSCTFRFFVAFLLLGGAVAGSARSWQTLSTFTVPVAALPSGCALKQPAPTPGPITRRGVTVVQGGPSSLKWAVSHEGTGSTAGLEQV